MSKYFGLLPLLLPLNALANEVPKAHQVTSQGAYLAQVLVGLLAVLAMIFIMGWVLKKLGQGTIGSNGNLKVVSSLSLGTREKIALIQVADQQLLVGITPNNIRTLKTFDTVVVEAETLTLSENFSEKLAGLMSRQNPKSSKDDD